ncbi:hypothetical protein GCM10009733_072480 [Nonomuraea maheshkhaliensis]|uniref:Uncharacterized protein n=1 Tax=Nonomuraea maheshkhaliensis TaxID=419590 RepID=A0ABP4S5M3_9ACTN
MRQAEKDQGSRLQCRQPADPQPSHNLQNVRIEASLQVNRLAEINCADMMGDQQIAAVFRKTTAL